MFPVSLLSLAMSSKGLSKTGISVTFYFIFFRILFSFRACPFHMPLLSTSQTVVFCLSLMPRFSTLAAIWMLGIRIVPAFEGILSTAITCWWVVVLEIGILKLLAYSWIPERRCELKSIWFQFFCVFLFQCSCFCLLVVFSCNHLSCFQLAPSSLFQPPSVESTVLINLFLFFSLEMTALTTLKLDPVHLRCRRWCPEDLPVISMLNSRCSLWPICSKVSTCIFRFFSAGS